MAERGKVILLGRGEYRGVFGGDTGETTFDVTARNWQDLGLGFDRVPTAAAVALKVEVELAEMVAPKAGHQNGFAVD